MNISFIYSASDQTKTNFPWRGIMIYRVLKKDKMHSVDLIESSDFENRPANVTTMLQRSQIIVIEGSLNIDLLHNINYWKSRGKVVIVDLPLDRDPEWKIPLSNNSIVDHIRIHTKKISMEIESIQTFQWGVHLADAITLSSPLQQEKWQTSAPLQIIPDYIEVDRTREIIKLPHDGFNIGILVDKDIDPGDPIIDFIATFSTKYPHVNWLPIIKCQIGKFDFLENHFQGEIIQKTNNEWLQILSILDLGWIYSTKLENKSSRIPLEMMAMKIPWIANESKYYQELAEFGLFLENSNNWEMALSDILANIDIYKSNIVEVSYLYSLSRNIDDHIHEIIHTISSLIKNSKA